MKNGRAPSWGPARFSWPGGGARKGRDAHALLMRFGHEHRLYWMVIVSVWLIDPKPLGVNGFPVTPAP